MKTLGLAAAALGAIALYGASSGGAGLDLSVRVALRPDSIATELAIEGARGRELVLCSLVPPRALGLVRIQAFGDRGRELAVRRVETGAHDRFRIDSRAESGPIRVRYRLEPGTWVPDTVRGERHFGRLDERAASLVLAQLVLVPEGRVASVKIDSVLPTGWSPAQEPPPEIERPLRADWWRHALVAGPRPILVERPRPDLEVVAVGPLDARLRSGVVALYDELASSGPPARPVRVVLTPEHADRADVDLPGVLPFVHGAAGAPHVGTWRRLARSLSAAWSGATLTEVAGASGAEALLELGRIERRAQRAAAAAGLVPRDVERSMHHAAARMRESIEEVHRLAPDDPAHRAAREIVAPWLAWVAERDGPAGPGEEAASAWLARIARTGYRGSSVGTAVGASPSPEASVSDDQDRVFRVSIAYSADTEGFLETCGCEMSQRGGAARRATVVERWRSEFPPLIVCDLGHLSPIDPRGPEVRELTMLEHEVFLGATEALDLDAVCPGPDDFYAGVPWARGRSNLPTAAVGLLVGGDPVHPPWRVVERGGLRIGIVGFSELLEMGARREAYERHMVGVRFPSGGGELIAAVRTLRSDVDFLVVIGRFGPDVLRAVCDPDLGVGAVLVAGHPDVRLPGGASVGFVENSLVAMESVGSYGVSRVDLLVDESGGTVFAEATVVELDESVPPHPAVRASLEAFRAELVRLQPDVPPLFGGDPLHAGTYVGSRACAGCHPDRARHWRRTPHASAQNTLVVSRRHLEGRCVRCHVVGLGRPGGHRLGEVEGPLAGVQCESCHGAGAAHVRRPGFETLRSSPGLETCTECHDAKHSRGFPARFGSLVGGVCSPGGADG